MDRIESLSVATLARAKGLDPQFLRAEFGLTDTHYGGQPAVRVPYRDHDGAYLYDKIRLGGGSMRYTPKGSTPALYGLDRLAQAAEDSTVLLVEGESDVWTGAASAEHAVGIPGANTWRSEFAAQLRRFQDIVLWQEPGKAGKQLIIAVARDLPDARVIRGGDVKDLCELRQRTGKGLTEVLAARIAVGERLYDRALALVAVTPVHVIHRRGHSGAIKRGQYREPDVQLAAARRQSTVDVLVARGARLRGHGLWQQTRCPFPDHADRTPSFSVHVIAGRWRCMGCGRHGTDAIALIRQLDGLPFRGAVAAVAR